MTSLFRQPPPATGVILAGGRSSRLGRDKALEEVGGKPMLQRVAEAVAYACTEVVIVGEQAGREGAPLPQGTRWTQDREPGRGPLGGLHAGLAEAKHDLVLAVGCDMPFLNPFLLALLLQTQAQGPWEAVVPRVGGRLQPMHAVYRRSIAPKAEGLLRTSEKAGLHDLLAMLSTYFIDESSLRPFDRELHSFWSVNTEEDLEQARRTAYSPG
jgi:molybdopterin-guanine dinucleotide biosynthesis protein A